MAKRPFAIRVDQVNVDRFRALSTIKRMDGAELFSDLLTRAEKEMSSEELKVYKNLLELWRKN
ncbi:hypothetical protein [Sporolactobacillus nakayamae]|uniref:Uncharacterized protein n=1 Tax=Sporolactobacillus nakayamae TaxID=269670 RepID=A0A1I2QQD3_9BACL|nr:hypothetical protein [Sporolactobacillus nakayamae]SFG29499.1 hypothetical protein SAMN02982927_01290 [Sporolactobacillus nakayamae]